MRSSSLLPRSLSRGGSRRIALVRLAPLLLLMSGVACSGTEVTGSLGGRSGPRITGTGGAVSSAQLVGEWVRLLVFQDENGVVHSSETRWRFDDDGRFVRLVTATNFTFNLQDRIVTSGTWEVRGQEVLVVFDNAAPEDALRFPFRIEQRPDGPVLFLAGTAFARAV